MTRQKFIITGIILAIAAVVAAFSFRRDSGVEERVPAQMVDANNQPVHFADLKGKVLFVNTFHLSRS